MYEKSNPFSVPTGLGFVILGQPLNGSTTTSTPGNILDVVAGVTADAGGIAMFGDGVIGAGAPAVDAFAGMPDEGGGAVDAEAGGAFGFFLSF